jgi:rhomboid protease GluP
MGFDSTVLFWLVSLSSLVGLAMTWVRVRFTAPGWLLIYLAVLLLSLAGWLWPQPAWIYTAAAIWFLLILLPALVGRLYNRRLVQQRYAAARRLARIIGWLHPFDGFRELPKIIHAFALAQQGELTAASETLKQCQNVKSSIGLAAIINLYRIAGQWEELLVWYSQHRQEIDRNPEYLPVFVRAYAETGDLRGMVGLYERNRQKIGKLVPATSRDTCRLMLFAFCGKPQAVASLFGGSLAVLPAPNRAFWLATADLASGAQDAAKRQFEELLPTADPPLRRAIQRRLSRISIPSQPLDAPAQRLIEEAVREQGYDERFGAQPTLFSNRARATQILIALNVLMFGVETYAGGSTKLGVLYHLGALYPPAVRAGEWWRLIASTFLHLGALHLAMNMFGLWILGPFAEFALGFRRFVLVYLLAGVGSMATVLAFSSGAKDTALTVGASGCVMGLVGVWGATTLRGWVREKASAAKRRLVAVLLLVSLQVLFDSLIPQVSMTAHLSGALIGFAAAMLLRDRLSRPRPQ